MCDEGPCVWQDLWMVVRLWQNGKKFADNSYQYYYEGFYEALARDTFETKKSELKPNHSLRLLRFTEERLVTEVKRYPLGTAEVKEVLARQKEKENGKP